MNRSCRQYSLEQISRFIDNDLAENQQQQIKDHIAQCPECQKLIQTLESVSSGFNSHVQQQAASIDPAVVEKQVLERIDTTSKPSGNALPNLFSHSRPLKFTLAGFALVIGLFLFNMQDMGLSRGPSAIVKSVDTEFSSVMIIETQKTKHTIIWYSET